jgi:AcrR family transcriptional regulator
MSETASSERALQPGLRARKKTKTRFAIQQEALRLFQEHGYQATTVEQVADAAEVSPSTVYRYFPTKDALVLTDDYDPIMVERFRSQPPELSVVAAFRSALRDTFTDMPPEQVKAAVERRELIQAVPELRAAFADFTVASMRLVADLVAERTGRPADDPEVIGICGALLGVMLAGYLLGGDLEEQMAKTEAQLAQLESGFTL